MAIDLILGTAGHIDHGKTALVRALTGVDTDRLPEEQKRGITIELGFAELRLNGFRLGIVDVPGHERFVRNMLAGATGMDLALLVVAADDSVKPQTREHLEILRLLDLQCGVIALTKSDLAEPEWMDLVEAEVRELVADTFLATAPIIRTSAHTGQGIAELKAALTTAAESLHLEGQDRATGPFRMAVDTVYSMTGHGTVVSGSVLRGQIAVGDELEVFPGGLPARVRGLQNHGRDVENVQRGQRAAINLAGVHHAQIARGSDLATPGLLHPSKLLTVELSMLPSVRRPLKNRRRIRVHLGTTQVLATVLLHQADELSAGETCLAQLFLSHEVTTTWGQPFVVRSESPVVTIGGGRVLVPNAWKFRRGAASDWEQVEKLRSSDIHQRAAAAVYFMRWDDWQAADLSRCAGVDDPQRIYSDLLSNSDAIEQLAVSPTRTLRVHHRQAEQLREAILSALRRLHDENPRDLVIPASRLADRFRNVNDAAVYKSILASLIGQQRIESTPRGVALPGQGPQLSKKEKLLLEDIVGRYRAAAFRPPTVVELQKQTERNQAAIPQLVDLAEARGDLVRLNNDLYLHVESEARVRELLRERFANGSGFTVSQLRELLDVSRKYAVPLCEYLDRVGFTNRDGDLRVLVE